MVIDCNTMFGFWQRDCRDTSLAQLLRLMDRHGIDAALTCSSTGVWGDFVKGNAETLQVCLENPRLLPVLTVRPLHYLDCREQIATAGERGFRMVRFFPHEQGWSPRDLCFRRLIEPLVEAGLPVFWSYLDEADPLRPIPTLVDCLRGSHLPLIFGSVSYALGEFLSACELHPHCYTDTAQLFLLNELEIIRDGVGSKHMLFGSHAPFDDPAAPLEVIRHARLTEGERAAVLGGNAAELLGLEVATPSATGHGARSPGHVATQEQSIPRHCSAGPLIDVHAHYGPWPGLPNPYITLDDILATCDRFDIQFCILSSTVAIGYDVRAGNREVREIIEGQERLRGYVVIHPGYPELALQELREYLHLSNFAGAKLHPKHCGFLADSREARPLMEYLASVGKPLLAHTWFREMCDAMARLADALPDLTLILGHMGGDDWTYALELAADRPNMLLELCSGLAPVGKIERAAAMVGADRLLFGSDLTILDPGYTLGTVLGSEISESEKRDILYNNAKRLFGL